MDKYEYKLKLDQLKSLVAKEDYETAAEIANSINWKKVRNSNTLCMVGDIYEKVGKYEESKAVLLQAYDHSSIGRNIVAKLAEVALKAQNLEEAEEYYNEFVEIAPKDNLRYVIGYKLSCLKDAPISDRIAILEEFKDKEYSEIWAYELAVLYSHADMRDKCVATCDELILWFGDGEYVQKALDLKRRYQPLTPSQEEKYQRFRERQGMVEISIPSSTMEIPSEDVTTEDGKPIPEIVVTASKFNTVNLQEELARSMQQIMDATESGEVAESVDNIKKIVSDIPYLRVNEEVHEARQKQMNEEIDETLRNDFKTRMTAELPDVSDVPIKDDDQIEGQMSIEDVLSEWERMKVAAEEAMKTAEQRKLEMAKESALAEASEIMERLKALIPIISADEGEIPEDTDTIAENLKKDVKPILVKAEPVESEEDEEPIKVGQKSGEEEDTTDDSLEPELIAEVQASMSMEIASMQEEEPDEDAVKAAAVQLPTKEEALLSEALAQEVTAVYKEENGEKTEEERLDEEEALLTAGLASSIGAMMQEAKAAKAKVEEQTGDIPAEEIVEAEAEETQEEPVMAAAEELITPEEVVEAADEPETPAEAVSATPEMKDETADDIDLAIDAIIQATMAEVTAESQNLGEAETPESETAAEVKETASAAENAEEAETEPEAAESPAESVQEETSADKEDTDNIDSIQAELESMIALEVADAMKEEKKEPEVDVNDPASIEAALLAAADAIELNEEPAKEQEETPEGDAAKDGEAEVAETAEGEEEPERREHKSKFEMPDNLDDELEDEIPEEPAGYGMTEEQRKAFTYFLPVPGMEEKITEIVLGADNMNLMKGQTSNMGNLVVSGNAGTGKTVLATNLIKTMQKEVGKEEKRIGKIKAASLNKRDFLSLIPKMDGGYLIVEHAGELTKEKAISMSLAMGHETRGLTIVLEDTKENIDKVLSYDVGLAQKFTERIDIPVFTIDELINFAKTYANEMECEIDEMAVLALYNRLNNMNRIDHTVVLSEVKEILDQAINNAESGGIKKIFAKKYTDEDFLILREEDFEF